MKIYTLKRRKTKYYKEVVTEGETWGCFYNETHLGGYAYLKKPYNINDFFRSKNDLTLANSISELSEIVCELYEINSDGTVKAVIASSSPFVLTPYPEGDLTTTTTELEESTKDDYDIAKNEDIFYSLRRPDTTSVKSWTQPILTANGTLDGDGFAVGASSASSGYDVYKAFDGDNNSYFQLVGNAAGQDFTFYNPNPLNVTELIFTFYDTSEAYGIRQGKLLASNDNSTWTEIKSFDSFVTTWDVSNNKNFYKYYKVEIISGGTYKGYVDIKNINITANENVQVKNSYLLCREKN